MKKKVFFATIMFLVVALASCASATETTSTSDTYVSVNLPVDYESALSARNQLALGSLNLDGTPNAITPDQAVVLLPLWQALRSLQSSGSPASEEVNAVLVQIEATMTPEQLSAIREMQLTFTEMQSWATANGIEVGVNGGQQGQNSSPEARATRQAAEGVTATSTSSGGGESKLTSAMYDALIVMLEELAQ